MLNDDSVMAAAEATARRLVTSDWLASDESRVDRMFELILCTQVVDEDRSNVVRYIAMLEDGLDSLGPDAKLIAWSRACHALFASSGFQMLE